MNRTVEQISKHLDRLISSGFQCLTRVLFGVLTTPIFDAAFTNLVVVDDDQIFSLTREVPLEEILKHLLSIVTLSHSRDSNRQNYDNLTSTLTWSRDSRVRFCSCSSFRLTLILGRFSLLLCLLLLLLFLGRCSWGWSRSLFLHNWLWFLFLLLGFDERVVNRRRLLKVEHHHQLIFAAEVKAGRVYHFDQLWRVSDFNQLLDLFSHKGCARNILEVGVSVVVICIEVKVLRGLFHELL